MLVCLPALQVALLQSTNKVKTEMWKISFPKSEIGFHLAYLTIMM